MRRGFWLFVMAMTAFSSAVIADDYVIKVNQSLAQVAGEHGLTLEEVLEANPQIFNPALVRTGQRIRIPTGGSSIIKTGQEVEILQELRIPEAGITRWTNPGGNSFITGGDSIRVINMFSIPDSVKVDLISKVKNGEFEYCYISQGDIFRQMIFGNYSMANWLIAAWPDSSKKYKARIYSSCFHGFIYYLVVPGICNNWSWWSEKAPEKLVVITPEEPEPQQKLVVITPEEPPVIETPPPPAPEEPVLGKKFYYRPDTDISTGIFTDKHQSGNNPRGGWVVGNVYVWNIRGVDKIHSFGFAFEENYWQGVTGDNYYYYGRRQAVSVSYRLLTSKTEFQIRTGMGKVDDWGHIQTNPSGKYVSSQTSEVITAYVGLEKRREEARWFPRIRYSGQVDFDINQNDKTDYWEDTNSVKFPLNGKPSDKTTVNVGVDGSIYKLNKNFSLAGGISLMYYREGSSHDARTGFRVSPGMDFYGNGLLIGGVRIINPTYWSTSDHSIGLSAMADLTNIYKWRW